MQMSDTRTGEVWGQTYERKRQEEFIAFLEYLEQQLPAHITTIHLVLDNLSVHKGKKVQAWKAFIGDSRTEEDFADHIEATINTDPDAGWIFLVDQLNTHQSEYESAFGCPLLQPPVFFRR